MCSSEERERRPERDALIATLKHIRPPSLEGRADCETWSVDFSPDGSYFAWSMGHGLVKLIAWPLADAGGVSSKEKTLKCGQTVWSLAFGPRPAKGIPTSTENKSKLFLATGLYNGIIQIWDVETGVQRFELKDHQTIVRDLVFTPNGNLTLVSCSRDKTLRIWDLTRRGKTPHVLTGHKDWVYCCSVSPDCNMIASVPRMESRIYLWSLRSYTFIRFLIPTSSSPCLLTSCDFSSDGALLAAAAYSEPSWKIDLWDPYTAQHLASLEDCSVCAKTNDPLIASLCFSRDQFHLAFVTEDRALQVWEPGQDALVMETALERFSNGLCCTFHPRGGVIATGTRDGHVQFWRAPQGVPSLRHLCRLTLRFAVTTHQVMALPLPQRIMDFLTYRNIPRTSEARCLLHI